MINGRWAMLGVAGMLGVEALGYGDWYTAPMWAVTGGKATYFGSELPFQFDLGTLAAIVSGARCEQNTGGWQPSRADKHRISRGWKHSQFRHFADRGHCLQPPCAGDRQLRHC